MIGIADRVWAKVALQPGTRLDGRSSRRGASKSGTTATPAAPMTEGAQTPDQAAPAQTAAGSSPSSNAEIRKGWLRGNVALHDEVAPDPAKDATAGKPKGRDITGEAVSDQSRRREGPGLGLPHDPTDPTRRPGPVPFATVSTDDMTIRGLVLRIDQEHEVRGDGPGYLTKWTARALLTDKAPPPADPEGSPTAPSGSTSSRRGPASSPWSRDTRLVLVSGDDLPAEPDPDNATAPPAVPKPGMRRPAGERQGLAHDHMDPADGVRRPDQGSPGSPGGAGRFLRHRQRLDGRRPAPLRAAYDRLHRPGSPAPPSSAPCPRPRPLPAAARPACEPGRRRRCR